MLLDKVLVLYISIYIYIFNELITEKSQTGMCSINMYVCMYVINWFKTSEVVHHFITTALFRMAKR